jgi:NAD(P)-dependent dehydrogenase (short-subunit alcohol dehydrogenase family)
VPTLLSVGVTGRGLLYCLAAALPTMLERGGGRIVVVGVEDARDQLLRAWRAAVRTILEELSRELSSDGIHTAEVRLDTRQARDPEECSNTIVHALKDPTSPDDEPRTYRP